MVKYYPLCQHYAQFIIVHIFDAGLTNVVHTWKVFIWHIIINYNWDITVLCYDTTIIV